MKRSVQSNFGDVRLNPVIFNLFETIIYDETKRSRVQIPAQCWNTIVLLFEKIIISVKEAEDGEI